VFHHAVKFGGLPGCQSRPPGVAGGAQDRAPPPRYPAKRSYRAKSPLWARRAGALTGFTGKHFTAGKEKTDRLSFLYIMRKIYLTRKIYR